MLSSRNGEHRGASSPVFDLFTALGLVSQNFRLSERADQDCADEEEYRANHNDVELQGNVHEGAPWPFMVKRFYQKNAVRPEVTRVAAQ
jgi:hypothetical protein